MVSMPPNCGFGGLNDTMVMMVMMLMLMLMLMLTEDMVSDRIA